MAEYHIKPGKIGKKLMETYEKVEDAFVDKFLEPDGSLKTGKTAEKVVGAYQKIEDGVVGAYQKVEDAFVERFLEKEEDKHEEE